LFSAVDNLDKENGHPFAPGPTRGEGRRRRRRSSRRRRILIEEEEENVLALTGV